MRAIGTSAAVLLSMALCWGACTEDDDTSGAGAGAGDPGGMGGSGAAGAAGGAGGVGGSAPMCGDGTCDANESCTDCALDCGTCCGNGTCDANELCGTCADDCGVCTGAPIVVERGPYLQRGSTTETVVRWRTEDPTPSVVAYGLAPDNLSMIASSTGDTTEHEVVIDGLLPDTKFYYAFGAPESDLVGGDADHFVVTPPPTGTAKPTRVWVIGDSGTADSRAEDVRDAYITHTGARGTDLWLMLGDNAYNDGTDSEYQDAVFDMYPTLLRNVVLWPTLGNHDGHTANSGTQSGPYYDIFTLPTAAEAGGVASATEAYYSFDYGNIHFVCLDSYDTDTDPTGPMVTWVDNDLMANTLPWVVVFFHHPPYTKGSHDSDSEGSLEDMRMEVLPTLESHGVDLVLTGHSHSYERSFFLNGHYGASYTLDPSMLIDNGDGRTDGDGAYARPSGNAGAVYIVAGSSGKISGGDLDHPAMFASINELGSVVLDVDGLVLDASFINDEGTVSDWFTIDKN